MRALYLVTRGGFRTLVALGAACALTMSAYAGEPSGEISILTESGVVYPGDVYAGDTDAERSVSGIGGACNNPDPTPLCAGQIGIQGTFTQECPASAPCPWDCSDDMGQPDGSVGIQDLLDLLAQWGGPGGCDLDGGGVGITDLLDLLANWGACPGGAGIPGPDDMAWTGTAHAFLTGGAAVDTVVVTLNTNNAGGDIYITGNTDVSGDCQPDVTNVLAQVCCAFDGQGTGQLSISFPPVATSDTEPTWVVFSTRSGQAGIDPDSGLPNGATAPGHQVARDDTDMSSPNQSFANLVGTGNPGDWTDLHDLGDPPLGTPYCVDLTVTGNPPDVFDCENPPNVGACCEDVDGPTCNNKRGWECGVDGGWFQGDGTDCANVEVCTCGAGAGACLDVAGNGSPGCETLSCCIGLCSADNFCCAVEWDSACGEAALQDLASCLPDLEACNNDVCLQTGSLAVDGNLRICSDVYGSFATGGFGGNVLGGDMFNPAGAPTNQEASFTTGLFFFHDSDGDGTNDARELLSCNSTWQGVFDPDDTILRQVLTSTTDNGGVVESSFRVLTPDMSLDLNFELAQSIAVGTLGQSAVLTQTYTITNNTAEAVEFTLLPAGDYDLIWAGASAADDSVGTNTNGMPGLDRHIFQKEFGDDNTTVTFSSPQGGDYVGNKEGVNPGGFDPTNPPADCPNYGFGTDTIFWDNFGLFDCWRNQIAGVGVATDGESGTTPDDCDINGAAPCDGLIILEIPVALEAGGSTDVTLQITYGSETPGG